eukprot:4827226-Pleurochrysis_carterae.AAC.1
MEMLRWSTADALRLYARLNSLEGADWRGAAEGAYIDSVRSATILGDNATHRQGDAAQRASIIEAAQRADVALVDVDALPRVDVHDVVGSLHHSADALTAAAAHADAEGALPSDGDEEAALLAELAETRGVRGP